MVNLAMDDVNCPGFLSLSLDLVLFIIYRNLRGKKISSIHLLIYKMKTKAICNSQTCLVLQMEL